MTITVVVADDEPIARQRVARMVEALPDAEVVAECAGGEEAVARTRELDPQVLFLDVQMPDLDGFAVVAALQAQPAPLPAIVFVTAFDQYALRAFEVHAVDYLLKPYDEDRFAAAFDRVRQRLAAQTHAGDEARLRALLEDHLAGAASAGAATAPFDRVAVYTEGTLRIVRTADVDWWETHGNYMRLHVGAASHQVRITASQLERRLDPRQFVRIHRRYIVNLDRVREIQPWFSGDSVVILHDRTQLRLSRSYRDRVHGLLLGGRGGAQALEPE